MATDANGNRIPVVTLRLLSAGAAGAALELLRLPLAPAANASVDLVAEVYSALGLALQQAPLPSAAPRRLAMPDLLPPQQPWADPGPLWAWHQGRARRRPVLVACARARPS